MIKKNIVIICLILFSIYLFADISGAEISEQYRDDYYANSGSYDVWMDLYDQSNGEYSSASILASGSLYKKDSTIYFREGTSYSLNGVKKCMYEGLSGALIREKLSIQVGPTVWTSGYDQYNGTFSFTTDSFSVANSVWIKWQARILTAEKDLENLSFSFVPDGSAPVISGDFPDSIYMQNFSLSSMSAYDTGSGIAKNYFTVEGIPVDSVSNIMRIANIVALEGIHPVCFIAIDNVGNSTILNQKIIVDRTAPTLALSGSTGPGWSNTAVTVYATGSDNLSGIDHYEWSLDNTTWTEGSSYTQTTEGTSVVFFRAVDKAGNISEVQSANVRIDRTAPTVTLAGGTGSGWGKESSISVNATASDAGGSGFARIERSLDNSTWTTASSYTQTAEGATTVYFRAIDNAENISAIQSANVRIDRTAPTVTVTSGTGSSWSNEPAITVTATGADSTSGIARIERSFDNSTWTTASSYTQTAEGATTVYFRAIDNAGYISAVQSTIVRIDRNAPTVTLTGGTGSGWSNAQSITVTATGADSGSGVARIEHSLNSSTWTTGSSFTQTGEGVFTVYFRAVDNVGYVSPVQSAKIQIERTLPIVAITGGTGSGWSSVNEITVTASASDSLSGLERFESSPDNAAWTTISGASTSITYKNEGASAIHFRAVDKAGNISAVQSANVRIDRTAPTVTVTGGTGSGWSTMESITVNAVGADSGSGVARIERSLDKSTWTTASGYTQSTEGATTVYFRAVDKAGLVSEAKSAIVGIDRTAPIVTLTGGTGSGWSNAQSVTVTATGADSASGVARIEQSLNGSTWTTASSYTQTIEGATTVYFRAIDTVGHVSEVKSAKIQIERTLPTLTVKGGTGTGWSNEPSITVSATGSDTGGAGFYGIERSLDDTTWTTAPSYEESAEGARKVHFRARDNAGNISAVQSADIRIDRTPPMVTFATKEADGLVFVRENGGAFFEDGSAKDPTAITILAKADAKDTGPQVAPIDRYEYAIQATPTPIPTIFKTVDIPTADEGKSEFVFTPDPSLLIPGESYLFIRAVDTARNTGLAVSRRVFMKIPVPNVVKITGETHASVPSGPKATPLSTASFKLVATIEGDAHIAAYDWELNKVTGAPSSYTIVEKVSKGSTATEHLTLNGLADNASSDERYDLKVFAVASNKQPGKESHYYFRVDTAPPKELMVFALPQAIASEDGTAPSAWYSSKDTTLYWQRPVDMSGVRNYYYRIETSPFALPALPRMPAEEDEKAVAFTGWKTVPDTDMRRVEKTISVKLLSEAASLPEGRAYFAICAEDMAGNLTYSSSAFAYDFSAPTLESASGFSISTPENGIIDVRVTGDADLGSGIASRELRITRYGDIAQNNWIGLASDGLASFDELEDGSYVVELRLRDHAGNEFNRIAPLVTFPIGAPPPEKKEIFEKVTRDAAGFVISGTVTTALESGSKTPKDGSFTLTLPKSYVLERKNDDGTWITVTEPLAAETVSLIDGLYRLSFDGTFRHGFSGFTAECEAPVFVEESGFSWSSMAVSRTLRGGGTRVFAYGSTPGSVATSMPPIEKFDLCPIVATSSSDPGNLPFDLTVNGKSGAAAWSFKSVESSTLSGSAWMIGKAVLGNASGENFLGASIGIKSAIFDSSGTLISAKLDVPFDLEIGGADFAVSSAYLMDDRLYIKEATLELGEGYSVESIVVNNFSIGSDGSAKVEKDFLSEEFCYTYFIDGNSTRPIVIRIIEKGLEFSGGRLLANGTIAIGNVTVAFGDLVIESSSIGLGGSGSVTFDGTTIYPVHGFGIRPKAGTAVTLGTRGFAFEAALLELPATMGGGTIELSGLVLGYDGYALGSGFAVRSTGTSAENKTASSSYGATISFSSFKLDSRGLFATTTLPLPPILGGGKADFASTPLLSDGTIGAAIRESALVIPIGGFPNAVVTGAAFAQGRIWLSSASVPMGATCSPSELVFTGMSANAAAILDEGSCVSAVTIAYADWSLKASGLRLKSSGQIVCSASAQAESASASIDARFPALSATAPGIYISGAADENSLARLADWDVSLAGATLTNSAGAARLSVPLASVKLPAEIGGTTITFKDLVLSRDASVVSCAPSGSSLALSSSSGLAVGSTDRRFRTTGPALDGSVALPSALGSASVGFPSEGISLYSDGGILASGGAGTTSYSFKGWPIQGSGWSIGLDGRMISSSNRVTYRGHAIELGRMAFFPDGSLAQAASFDAPGGIDLISDSFIAYEGVMDADGIAVRASAVLPQVLGGNALFFERVKLLPDGGFIPNASIAKYGFMVGGLTFALRDIRVDDDGLYVGEASLTLPEAAESATARIYGLSIGFDGSLAIAGADPFSLFGYRFCLSGLSISGGRLGFSGSLALAEGLPLGLGGKTLAIDSFSMSTTTGEVYSFGASCPDTLTFPIREGWIVTATGIGIEKKGNDYLLKLARGSLDFPPDLFGEDMSLKSASIYGLTINPLTGAVSFDSIGLEEFELQKFSCLLRLTSVTVDTSWNCDFAGSLTFPDKKEGLPEFLWGATVGIQHFRVGPDGIGDLDISASGLNGKVFGDISVVDAGFNVAHTGDDYVLGFSADRIVLGPSFPAGLNDGKARLSLKSLRVRLNDLSIMEFDASVDDYAFNLFGDANNPCVATIGLAKDDSGVFELRLSDASFLLNGRFMPDSLRGTTVLIHDFRMDTTGAVKSFDASCELTSVAVPARNLFPGIVLKGVDGSGGVVTPATIGVSRNAATNVLTFSVAGTLELGYKFPSGLAGTTCVIRTLVFDTSGTFTAVDASTTISNVDVFGGSRLSGTLAFSKQDSSDLQISLLGAALTISSTAPTGLAGATLAVSEFTITSTGSIKRIAASYAFPPSTPIFGGITLNGAVISVDGSASDDLTLRITGKARLPMESMPSALKGMELSIIDFRFSTKSLSIVAFDVKATTNGISFPLFAGITASIDSFRINLDGFMISSGTLKFPSREESPSFPEGLAGTNVTYSDLAVDWNGKITLGSAGLADRHIKVFGLDVFLRTLTVGSSGVAITGATITLPASLGGDTYAITEAGISSDGSFYGSMPMPMKPISIAGFTLKLTGPSIDRQKKAIAFVSASLQTPAWMLSSSITLNAVSIGADGISIGGGKFGIPKFQLASGLEFYLEGEFKPENGQTIISAAGEAMVPGVGTMKASASFTKPNATYPIGIVSSSFSYTVFGLGLPLGATGLFINEIHGSLCFGPPNEIPAEMRPYFDNGTRLGLGVGIKDGSGGTLFKGSATVWVDITDWDWAFQGKALILSGMIDSEILASLAGGVFYGKVAVRMAFVDGQAELWIWKEGVGYTKVAGKAQVQFKLPAGCIVDYTINCWLFDIHVCIPWGEIRLPGKFGAEIGTFKNGQTGVKGYVDVPLWGEVGIFAGKGTFSIGNVSQYELYVPTGRKSLLLPSDDTSRIFSRSAIKPTLAPSETYLFNVPTAKGAGRGPSPLSKQVFRKSSSAPATRSKATGDFGEEEGTRAETDRIIFVLGYAEGDPVLTVESPSGRIYAEGDPEVIVERSVWGITMAVLNPEPGQWKTHIANLPEGLGYELRVFGKIPPAEIELFDPSYAGELVSTTYTARGHSTAPAGSTVELRIGERSDSYFGALAATATVDEGGDFEASLDVSGLADGEYYLFASVEDEKASSKAYAPGSISIYDKRPLAAPAGLVAMEAGERTVAISFSDPNGGRAKGHYVYTKLGESEQRIDIGVLTATELPGFEAGHEYSIRVSAYDGSGVESAISAPVSIGFGLPKDRYNVFALSSSTSRVAMTSGGAVSLGVAYSVADARQRGDSFDRMHVAIAAGPEWLALSPKPEGYDLTASSDVAELMLLSMAAPPAGEYAATLVFESMGNPQIRNELALSIEVSYPLPSIQAIAPSVVNRDDSNIIDVVGENFINGTKVQVDGVDQTLLSIGAQALSFRQPAGLAAGAHEVAVIGPGGAKAATGIRILAPYYSIVLARTEIAAQAGSTVGFPFDVVGENGFVGSASLAASGLPQGWTADSGGRVAAGSSGSISVTIPADAALGPYAISFMSDQGDRVDLALEVVAGTPAPVIQSLSSHTVIAGDTLRIFGYGFGGSGSLELNGTALSADSWSDTEIVARIGDNLASGDLIVARDGLRSAGVALFVLNAGFTLHLPVAEIDLQPGEARTVSIAVSGVKRPVDLTVASRDASVAASASSSLLVPNASFELTVRAAADIANGAYDVVIDASSGTVKRQARVVVRVGEAFEVTTGALPPAMEGCSYRSELKSENASGEVAWSLVKGELPSGIWLKSGGVLEGKPSGLGTFDVTLRATDTRGRTADKALTLVVEENAWSQGGKDSGRSGYGGSAAPATERAVWSSEAVAGAARLVTGGRRVYAYGAGGLKAFDIKTGRTLYAIEGNISEAAYDGGLIYVLEGGGKLRAFESEFGNEYWSLDSVVGFIADGARLLASDGASTSEFAPSGALVGQAVAAYAGGFSASDRIIAFRGTILRARGSEIQALKSDGWSAVYSGEAAITAFACDEYAIAIADADGKLRLLDENYAASAAEGIGLVADSLNLSPSEVVASGGGSCALIGRASGILSKARSGFASRGRYALASEKLAIAGADGLEIRNVYTGGVIWSSRGEALDAVCAVERVFALGTDGVARCYGGAENALPPETAIMLEPRSPNGDSGWYRTLPIASLTAADAETYVASTMWKIGTGAWEGYAEPRTLGEGEYPIYAYSVDSKLFRESEKYRNVRIDTTPPYASLTLSAVPAPSGWLSEPTIAVLSATDSVSGVSRTEYRLGASDWIAYTGPQSFTSEGAYELEGRAIDAAGNESAIAKARILIDLADPEPSARSCESPGMALIYMEAKDSASGVARIEYRVDGGDIKAYAGPVSLTQAGARSVEYRAVDIAGRISAWRVLSVVVPEYKVRGLIRDLRFGWPGTRSDVVEGAAAGMPMYLRDRSPHNVIDSLPGYAAGAEFIRMDVDAVKGGGAYLLSFIAGEDMVAYLFKAKDAQADLRGWTLKESSYLVEGHQYFIGGAEAYERRCSKGERVLVPNVKGRKAYPPLVFAQHPRADVPVIATPAADEVFWPLQDISLSAITLAPREEGSFFSWKAWVDGVERKVTGDVLTLPYVHRKATLRLRVDLTGADGKRRGSAERDYPIVNRADIELRSPAPGWSIVSGSKVRLGFSATDLRGNAVAADSVTWLSGCDPRYLSPLALSADKAFFAPNRPGPFFLKAVWAEDAGREREKLFFFAVSPFAYGVTIRFGEGGRGLNSDGEAYGPADAGLYYGFDDAAKDSLGGFTAQRMFSPWFMRLERSGFIEVPAGNGFKLLTGAGRFEVKALVGPYDKQGRYELRIADKALAVDHASKKSGIYELRCEATVGTDGVLRLKGGEGLRLIELRVRQMPENAPAIETSVRPASGIAFASLDRRMSAPRPDQCDAERWFEQREDKW